MSKHSHTFCSFVPCRMTTFSETSTTSCQMSRCHIPDDNNPWSSRKTYLRNFLSKIQYLWSMALNPALHCLKWKDKRTVHEEPSILFYCDDVELWHSHPDVISYEWKHTAWGYSSFNDKKNTDFHNISSIKMISLSPRHCYTFKRPNTYKLKDKDPGLNYTPRHGGIWAMRWSSTHS